jgi:hypothetical protein
MIDLATRVTLPCLFLTLDLTKLGGINSVVLLAKWQVDQMT